MVSRLLSGTGFFLTAVHCARYTPRPGGIVVSVICLSLLFTAHSRAQTATPQPGSEVEAAAANDSAETSPSTAGKAAVSDDAVSDSTAGAGSTAGTADKTGTAETATPQSNRSRPVIAAPAALTASEEEPAAEWFCTSGPQQTEVLRELVNAEGRPTTRFLLRSQGTPEALRLTSRQKPSRLHYDFSASVQVEATFTGATLALEIMLPDQTDPRTGKPLTMYLPGDMIRREEQVQMLRVTVTKKGMEALLRRTRAELNRSDIRLRAPLITGLAILTESSPGDLWLDVGASTYGPVITPPESLISALPVTQSVEVPGEIRGDYVPLDVELGAIMVNRQPGILRLLPDHEESIATLRELGVNSVWVSDHRNLERSKLLAQEGLAVIATPPHPEFSDTDFSTLRQSLPPLDQFCPHVSAWYEGTRVIPAELPHLLAWSREVRSADRVHQRLQMADVTGAEGAAAREIDLVGMGRHVVGREESFGALRNLLLHRQKTAGQLSFPWTWVQVEPSSMQLQWRNGAPLPIVEPEQIQHQVYAALSAGYRGIGFWKTRPLQSQDPGDREILLAMEIADLEISLLEPFLARGRREGYLALQIPKPDLPTNARNRSKSASLSLNGTPSGVTVTGLDAPTGHDAVVISGNGTTLILAVAWDNVSQYVPAPMYEREVSMIVAATETASAWQISTTGIRSLPREVTAGGLAIRIRDFDRSSALIVTSDTGIIRVLEQKIHAMAGRSAEKSIELATLKHKRVMGTIETLRNEHVVPAGTDKILTTVQQSLDRADFERKNGDFQEAALLAADAMRNLRLLQHLCWKDAVAELTSPTASPHTISFATLPEHWRLMRYVRQNAEAVSENLLSSGSFDQQKNLALDGWTREVADKSVFSATADIIPSGNTGKMLRLAAWYSEPGMKSGTRDDLTPLSVTSPPIPVAAGDIMFVRGRVRRGVAVSAGSRRSLLLFDSELGAENGLKPELTTEWIPFEMIRPITRDGQFRFSASLTGQAEVHLDDLEIRKLTADAGTGTSPFRMTGATDSAPTTSTP